MLVTAKVLKWFEERLPPQLFTRMHRSHLINKNYLHLHQQFGKTVALQNENIIPISRRRKKMVWQKFAAACLLFFMSYTAIAQSVGVGTITPHASAALDVVSNNKGMAIPSLTSAQGTAIAAPKTGLFVFDTDRKTICMFNGSNWVYFQSFAEPNLTLPVEQVASDGELGDQFGYSVDISGNYAVIGAPFDNVGANFNQGSAYIFFFNGTNWEQQAKILASNGAINDEFGTSVSISGDYVIVGAPRDDVGANMDQGSAYIFFRNGVNWTQQANITSVSALAGDRFGFSVSIDNSYCMIGAPFDDVGADTDQGTFYVFSRSGVVWSQEDYVTYSFGAAGDNFGYSVSISGSFAIVGAPYNDETGSNNVGAAYFYERNGSNWDFKYTWNGGVGPIDKNYGYAVSIEGNYAVAGGPHLNGGYANAHAFYYNGVSWIIDEEFRILHLGINPNDQQYGYSVSYGGNFAVVGSPAADTLGYDSGITYLFQTDGSQLPNNCFFVRRFTDPTGTALDRFGAAVAVSGNYCIVSSPKANGSKGKVVFLKL